MYTHTHTHTHTHTRQLYSHTTSNYHHLILVCPFCTYVINSYNTPRRAVSDLQSPILRARRAQGGDDCKSDAAQLGLL